MSVPLTLKKKTLVGSKEKNYLKIIFRREYFLIFLKKKFTIFYYDIFNFYTI